MTHKLRLALLPVFAFAGALLMFVLEPLVGRILLPAYGGSFQVWTTCLMFFQGVLLLGYLYAHFVGPRIGRWHVVVVALPLLLLPIDVTAHARANAPILSILAALIACVALPIAVLSTTGVMAQTWLARSDGSKRSDPYWLYAASNAGSLIGLLMYPLLVEPLAGLRAQRLAWSALYVAYVALTAAVAPRMGGLKGVPSAEPGVSDEGSASATLIGLWLTLSMAASIMLMAVTNAIAFDVGSVPLVWVAPLALYLTTFILVFRKQQLYPRLLRDFWLEAAVAGLVVLVAAPMFPSWPRMAIHLLALFALCMAAHGELHRLRPPAAELTKFYLVISIGGWIGGVLVSVVAPVVFSRLLEYPIAILLVAGALAYARRATVTETAPRELTGFALAVHTPAVVTGLAFAGVWLLPTMGPNTTRQALLRNHYGIYQVGELPNELTIDGEKRTLEVRQIVHNGTMHGAQVIGDELRHEPIAYYHRAGGLGDVMSVVNRPFKLGAVGLGAGTSAAFLGPQDEIVYYEIDPDDEQLARRWFTYLEDCLGRTRVVIGDARVMLAADLEAPDHYFDALSIDAFSGDAIPTHLLTVEAIELYRRKVRPGGILAFHITNRFYDLRPVLESARRALHMYGAYKSRDVPDGLEPLENRTRYWAMSEDPAAIDNLVALGWTRADDASAPMEAVRTWTDDYVNVLAPLWAQARKSTAPTS